MVEKYSIKNAAKWAGAGLTVSGLAGSFYAAAHYMSNHFETLSESFAHVAQPGFIAGAVIASAAFGAFMEFKSWYGNRLSAEEAEKALPERQKRTEQPQSTSTGPNTPQNTL